MKAHEVNFDGIVGPTHNYGGLAYGNIASIQHRYTTSSPRSAALQGFAQMKLLSDLGLKQAVLPPHERPALQAARELGYSGPDTRIPEKLAKEAPFLLASLYSSSAMWAANAATVSPGPDTADGRVHFTPANLVSQFHRSLEAEFTATVLKRIFTDDGLFAHHPPLPGGWQVSDEGAANHTRLCASYGDAGVELFVYGRDSFNQAQSLPSAFPARQSLEASKAVIRLHKLDERRVVLAKQNPAAIDAGVFHNDVISVGNGNVFLHHSLAFEHSGRISDDLRRVFSACCNGELMTIEVSPDELSLEEAVRTYIFNSRLLTLPDNSMCLIAPAESEEHPRAKAVIYRIVAEENPIRSALFVDVRQSMQNGGGPACLRLRVVLTEREMTAAHQGVFFTDTLYEKLVDWVKRHYREELRLEDLADPALIDECRSALDQLTYILRIGSIYEFQK